MKVAVKGQDNAITRKLIRGLDTRPGLEVIRLEEWPGDSDAVVYAPRIQRSQPMPLSKDYYHALFTSWLDAGQSRLVLLSSSHIHPPKHGHPGMVGEIAPARPNHDRISCRWLGMEQAATEVFGDSDRTSLAILRLTPVPIAGGKDYFSCLLRGPFSLRLPGYDPCLQLLSPDDLVNAVAGCLEKHLVGIFNIAPSGVIPLNKALSRAGVWSLPVPWLMQAAARKLLAPLKLAWPTEQIQRIRYSSTITGEHFRQSCGIEAGSAYEAVSALENKPVTEQPRFDDFGWDPKYVDFQAATQLRFLHDMYWRVEYEGLEQIPREGRAILLGVHRGFMPYDGTMILYAVLRALKRYPRFLIHPCLVKQPFLANFISKLGGLIACRENADRILNEDKLLGVFPEGIQGAFTYYKDAFELGNFGRDEYVRMALRNRAPIVPFVTVGSAEIYPILGRIDWGWWRRFSEWPFMPITPTFPLVPLPLPSKWHTRVLPAISLEQYGPEAAGDPEIVARIGAEIKAAMQDALYELKENRKSIFFGSIFHRKTRGKAPRLSITE